MSFQDERQDNSPNLDWCGKAPREWAEEVTRYHDAPYAQEQWDAIRLAAKNFIIEIQRSCPACGDRDTAIKYANAAIALEGLV